MGTQVERWARVRQGSRLCLACTFSLRHSTGRTTCCLHHEYSPLPRSSLLPSQPAAGPLSLGLPPQVRDCGSNKQEGKSEPRNPCHPHAYFPASQRLTAGRGASVLVRDGVEPEAATRWQALHAFLWETVANDQGSF